jgi:hypothetical protein
MQEAVACIPASSSELASKLGRPLESTKEVNVPRSR